MSLRKEKLDHLRDPGRKEIGLGQWSLYLATAASLAAAANDLAMDLLSSALGNFGLLLIMGRLYFFVPYAVAKAKGGSKEWIRAEKQNLDENFPWADKMGKLGWGVLIVGVVMQISEQFL